VYWRSLGNLLIVSTSTTSGYVIYNEFKPKSVTVYLPAAVQTGAAGFVPTAAALDFTAGSLMEDAAQPLTCSRKYRALNTMSGKPESVRVKFDKPYRNYDTFQVASLTNTPLAFQVFGPVGMVVDLEMVVRLFGDDRNTLGKTSTTTAATAQVPYFNVLDAHTATGSAGTSILSPTNTDPNCINANAWL
jgi:hypothetical protein